MNDDQIPPPDDIEIARASFSAGDGLSGETLILEDMADPIDFENGIIKDVTLPENTDPTDLLAGKKSNVTPFPLSTNLKPASPEYAPVQLHEPQKPSEPQRSEIPNKAERTYSETPPPAVNGELSAPIRERTQKLREEARQYREYSLAEIASQLNSGMSIPYLSDEMLSKIKLRTELSKFDRLLLSVSEFSVDGLSEEDILSGFVLSNNPLRFDRPSKSPLSKLDIRPYDGNLGLAGSVIFPVSKGTKEATSEITDDLTADLNELKECHEKLMSEVNRFKDNLDKRNGFGGFLYRITNRTEVTDAFDKYSESTKRYLDQRKKVALEGYDVSQFDVRCDAEALFAPLFARDKVSSVEGFARTLVRASNLTSILKSQFEDSLAKVVTSGQPLSAPMEESNGVVEKSDGTQQSPEQSAPKSGQGVPSVEPQSNERKALFAKIELFGVKYEVPADGPLASLNEASFVKPPKGHKFAHPELPLIYAAMLFSNADAVGEAKHAECRSHGRPFSGSMPIELPLFLYIDDRLPSISDPIQQLKDFVEFKDFGIEKNSFVCSGRVPGAVGHPNTATGFGLEGVKSDFESMTLGKLKSENPTFDPSFPFKRTGTNPLDPTSLISSEYSPPKGMKLAHPLLPLLFEAFKRDKEEFIRDNTVRSFWGNRPPPRDLLIKNGYLDSTGADISFPKSFFIPENEDPASFAEGLMWDFARNLKQGQLPERAAVDALSKSIRDPVPYGLKQTSMLSLGLSSNDQTRFYSDPELRTGAYDYARKRIAEQPRGHEFKQHFGFGGDQRQSPSPVRSASM